MQRGSQDSSLPEGLLPPLPGTSTSLPWHPNMHEAAHAMRVDNTPASHTPTIVSRRLEPMRSPWDAGVDLGCTVLARMPNPPNRPPPVTDVTDPRPEGLTKCGASIEAWLKCGGSVEGCAASGEGEGCCTIAWGCDGWPKGWS